MKLENILNLVDTLKMEEQFTKEILENKLGDLKKYQNETEVRKDNINKNLFPQKIKDIIIKLTYSGGYYQIRKDKAIKINLKICTLLIYYYESCICVELDDKKCKLQDKNKFDEIFDWWSNDNYVESHMIKRFNELNNENYLLDILNDNIEEIYNEIAIRIKNKQLEETQKNVNNLNNMIIATDKKPTKKQITIIIEIG